MVHYPIKSHIPQRKFTDAAASVFGSSLGFMGSIFGSQSAADAQLAATRETNRTNYQIAQERNAQEMQMFHEANEFNANESSLSRAHAIYMQQQAQDYNSIGSQIDRARESGVNPAAVVGGAGTTPVSATPSSAAASSAGIPNLTAAQMQVPDLSALQGVSAAFANLADSQLKLSQARNVNADTQSKMTYNKFQSEILQSGLDVSKSEIRKNYAAANEMTQSIQLIQQHVKKLQSDIVLQGKQGKVLDQEALGKQIENKFKSKEIQAHIRNLQSITGLNEIQAKWLAETFVARAYGVTLQNRKTAADIGLSESMANYYGKLADLTVTQNAQAAYDFQMDRLFESRERSQGLALGQQRYDIGKTELKSAEWNTSTPVMILHEAEGLVGSFGSVLTGTGVFYGARAAAKRANQTSGSQLPANTTSYKPLPPKAGYRVIKRGDSYEYQRE